MDINSEKARILNIYETISSKGLYKKANIKEKIFVYILPPTPHSGKLAAAVFASQSPFIIKLGKA